MPSVEELFPLFEEDEELRPAVVGLGASVLTEARHDPSYAEADVNRQTATTQDEPMYKGNL